MNSSCKRGTWFGIAAALLAAVVAQPVAATSLPRPCPGLHAPACGVKDGVPRTYANICDAGRDGAVRITRGRCRRRAAEPTMCPMIYAPVCAVKDGRFKTYGNECQAKAAGATVQENFACVKM